MVDAGGISGGLPIWVMQSWQPLGESVLVAPRQKGPGEAVDSHPRWTDG